MGDLHTTQQTKREAAVLKNQMRRLERKVALQREKYESAKKAATFSYIYEEELRRLNRLNANLEQMVLDYERLQRETIAGAFD